MLNHTKPEPGTSSVILTLSSTGLRNIIWSNYEENFEFEVCGQHYFCPSFVAEFLSPRISKLSRNDCTIGRITIAPQHSSDCVRRFLSLGFGFPVSFKSEDYSIVQLLWFELENVEVYEQLSEIFDGC
jgi:hypothetical protein